MGQAALEDAVRGWVKTATGFADDRVYFTNRPIPRPATGAYCTIAMGAPVQLGACDSVAWNYDAGRDPGVEIEKTVDGRRERTVRVQVWQAPTVGDSSAVGLAEKLRTGLRRDDIRIPLMTAGMTPFDYGTVQDLSVLLGTAFDGRAALDVRFYHREQDKEYTTYISTVGVHDTERNTDITVDLGA